MRINKIKNISIKLFALLTVSLFVPFGNVHAEEKSSTVEISEAGQNLTFTIDFENAGEYSAVLSGPSDESYDYVAVDDDTMSVDVAKVKAGQWVTTVTSADDVTIGKYTLSVTGKKATATTNVDSSITVGKDIVGLNIYFKDNSICMDWTDTSIGTIVAKVVNLDNSEVLAEENVDGTSFSCEIPDGVKNVSVSVVPSTSRNVEGAAQTFTYEVPTKPSVDIVYGAEEYTNQSSVNATITINEDYSFYVENNNVKIYSSELNPAGTYDVTLNLDNEGENNIKFYVIDVNGNMFSYDKLILRDTAAPTLTLSQEYDQFSTYDETIDITGNVTDYSDITINEESIDPSTDGTFTYTASLHVGENLINIKAVDNAGNEVSYDVTIIRKEKKQMTLQQKIMIIGGAIFLILLILFIVFRKKIASLFSNIHFSSKEDKIVSKKENERKDVASNSSFDLVYWIRCHKNKCIQYGIFFVVWIYVFFIGFSFSVSLSGSMEPTIMTKDFVINNKLAYVTREPERGDIIEFKMDGKLYGKRIVGIAGDTIEFHDGYVYINGEYYDESAYLDEDMETNCSNSFTVPEGCIFVMGDNRENSKDSRFWENPYIPVDDIVSKTIAIIPTHIIF